MAMDDPDTANRRLRLIALIEKFESRAQMVRRYDLNDSYLHQLINGIAPFGEKAARNLENQMGLTYKYFDQLKDGGPVIYPGTLPSSVLKLAERVAELGAAGKLTEQKADAVLRVIEAMTEESSVDVTDSAGQRAA